VSDLPGAVQINAYAGDTGNTSPLESGFRRRLLATRLDVPDLTAAPRPIDPRDWTDLRVGWGVVLADRDDLAPADKARALDAPLALQQLIGARRGVTLRYRADRLPGSLRRHYDDGHFHDIMVGTQWGAGVAAIPRYLLIYGSPSEIPWQLQFELQFSCFVGRIDLAGAALERYVEALQGGWAGSVVNKSQTLAWAVDQPGDITGLMRDAIAEPLNRKFVEDGDYSACFIDGRRAAATGVALGQALASHRPALVVTTSHGMTGPLGDVPKMAADLGLLVDSGFELVRPQALLDGWQPDGAIWYAHACCSAGSLSKTAFDGLVPAGSDVDRILRGIAGCGDTIAPFPQALLSASRPLKAFVGHVEPTFDWSLRQLRTTQYLTMPLLDTLYQGLFTGEPIGMALDRCRRVASGFLHASYASDLPALGGGEARAGDILALKLVAKDWRAFVLLGDPTCRIA
jgi:hypothetical protein